MTRLVFSSQPVTELFTYSVPVTAADQLLLLDARIELQVADPPHLSSFDGGQGAPGFFAFDPSTARRRPVVLYPGEISISVPYQGGTISLVHTPFAVAEGAISISYRVMFGETQVASSLPYNTTEAAGSLLTVWADVTANGVTTTAQVGQITIAENPLGPQLTNFTIDYDTNTISFVSDLAATVTWRRYPPGHTFVNQAEEVLAGTGAIDGGTFSITTGENSQSVTFTGGVSGAQQIWIVARVGSGPVSNVVGGPVNITVTTGTPLTAPTIVGTSVGGYGFDTGDLAVSSVTVALPNVSMLAGDLITVPVGIDCAGNQLAGITGVGPNGETLLIRRPTGASTDIVGNGVTGNTEASIVLLYCRNSTPRTGGNVTINITPGGNKNEEQLVLTPIVRRNVRASGDPFAQVLHTFSGTFVNTASTASLTAVSAASRIEACFVNDLNAPPGTAPEGWFTREVARQGPQSIQTMSRNDQTEVAGQVIAPVSVPLGFNTRWVGLTWELLPLGS